MLRHAFVLTFFILGCSREISPIAPAAFPASKNSQIDSQPCLSPQLIIEGIWRGRDSYRIKCSSCEEEMVEVSATDVLRLSFAPASSSVGEPGVIHYNYELLSYYDPSSRNFLNLAHPDLPFPFREQRGKMGIYPVDGNMWNLNHLIHSVKTWDSTIQGYEEFVGGFSPEWGVEIRLFDGVLLFQQWSHTRWFDFGDREYYRLDDQKLEELLSDLIAVEIEVPVEPEPIEAVITSEIISMYEILISTVQKILFAELVDSANVVLGESGGLIDSRLENQWHLQYYSPDLDNTLTGIIDIGLNQSPISLTGTIYFIGLYEAEFVLDVIIIPEAENPFSSGTLTVNGAEFNVESLNEELSP